MDIVSQIIIVLAMTLGIRHFLVMVFSRRLNAKRVVSGIGGVFIFGCTALVGTEAQPYVAVASTALGIVSPMLIDVFRSPHG